MLSYGVYYLFKNNMSKPWELSTTNCESVESEYPCPIDDCTKHGDRPIKWTHTNCGGNFRLYENGKEKNIKNVVTNFFSATITIIVGINLAILKLE